MVRVIKMLSCVSNVGSPIFNNGLVPASSVVGHAFVGRGFTILGKNSFTMQERIVGKAIGCIQLLDGVFRMRGCFGFGALGGLTLPFIIAIFCYIESEG